jgi:hypothetical protein
MSMDPSDCHKVSRRAAPANRIATTPNTRAGLGLRQAKAGISGTSLPNSHPCVAGTLFNTCALAHNLVQGTFGNTGRNIIEGPGYKTWHMSLVKQFPIREQMYFEFRAEFFNILNHVNYLFSQWRDQHRANGLLELDPNNLNTQQNPTASPFGYRQAARAPRQIQLALNFYF